MRKTLLIFAAMLLFLSIGVSNTNMTIWEAYGQDLFNVISDEGDVYVSNLAEVPVVIEDYIMLMDQYAFLTPQTVPAESRLSYSYGPRAMYYPADSPVFWRTGFGEPVLSKDHAVPLTGEIAPIVLQDIVTGEVPRLAWFNPYGEWMDGRIMGYIEENPVLVIGKTPFTSSVRGSLGKIEYTLTITNIGGYDAEGIIVQDTVPRNFLLMRNSFSVKPESIRWNGEGWNITWTLPNMEGYNDGSEYKDKEIKYTVWALRPWRCNSTEVPGATVEWNDKDSNIQVSYSAQSVVMFERSRYGFKLKWH